MAHFCRDVEGFTPFSRVRDFDLTPCFEEGILNSSLLGVLLLWSVLGSLYLCLVESQTRSRKSRVILGAKILSDCWKASLFLALASSVATLIVALHLEKPVPVLEAYILEPLGSIFLSYYNHTRARRSASVLLLFWPAYTICLAIWARTTIWRDFDQYRLVFLLKGGTAIFGLFVSFSLECIGPEIGLSKDEKSIHEDPPILTANIFSRWTFGWMTGLMAKGTSKFVTEDDLPSLVPSDESENLGKRLEKYLTKYGVWSSLWRAYGGPFMLAVFLKLLQVSGPPLTSFIETDIGHPNGPQIIQNI
ncbi:hypothetical protein C8R45DRAFT_1071980 [Mycena sanguinolenta]|nr:hypothetical protein C8R45DRAFT_1071980 [Mycena sanguinolenta]